MGGMHGFGPVVVPGSDEAYHEPWEARTSRSRRWSASKASAAAVGVRFERRWIRSTTFAPRTTSAGSGAPSNGSCARARLRRARSTRGSNGCRRESECRRARIPSRRRVTAQRSLRCDRSEKPTRRGLRPAIACACDDGATRGTRAALATYAAPKGSSSGTRHRRAARHRAVRRPGRARLCGVVPLRRVFGASDEVQWTVMLDLSETYLEPA